MSTQAPKRAEPAQPSGLHGVAASRERGARLRFNPKPDEVRKSVLKLVLTLVELIRRLMENQAVRRMEDGTLTQDELERVGLSLSRLEQTIVELAEQFEIPVEDLNLDLGPLGRLI